MLNFLFFILVFILVIVFGVIFFIVGSVSALFRRTKKNANESDIFQDATPESKKIFTPNEGEYVEFEEIKDEK
ncbi:MAG: DUF4834 family protein [Paludibacteraceae bacterium]